jgi:hypothetical protein
VQSTDDVNKVSYSSQISKLQYTVKEKREELIILIRKLRISGMENTRSKPVACPTDMGLTTRKFGKNKNPVDY